MAKPNHTHSSNMPCCSCFTHGVTPSFRVVYCPSSSSSSSSTFSRFHRLISLRSVYCMSSSSKTPPEPPPQASSFAELVSMLRALPDWTDSVKERGMRKKRSLYKHDNWLEHRSSLRHVRHLFSSLNSRVIVSLIPPVFAFTCFAVIIASYNSAVEMHWLPPEIFPVLKASSLPYQLTAPALALLLVFRTEASYSRFEQGKKAWTKVISGTNDFATQVISTVENGNGNGNGNRTLLKNALLQYIMAFPVALKCHIIHGSDVAGELRNILEADDLAVVLSSKHRPRCIIEFISQSLHSMDLEETKRHVLESKISCFHEGIGVCEQLLGIPIPLSYTRLTSRFLVLWHLTLPVILWDDCNWIVVPATFISAASLFCIEEVGVLIEEPFSMLALDDLCNVVQTNVQQAIANENIIKSLVNGKRKTRSDMHAPNGWPHS